MAKNPIKLPDSNDDPKLTELVNRTNNPSTTVEERNGTITMLGDYIERLAKDKIDKEETANQDRERVEKRWQEKQASRPSGLREVHRITNKISKSMKEAFSTVLEVLKGGIKVLDSLAFVAAELTFQTHYAVALNAIMFLITVSGNLI